MNVLQVCPLWYAVTPDAAGGIESLVASLSRHLARAGCRLTHLAPAGSDVAGDLVPVVERPLFDLMTEGLAGVYEPYEQHELRLAIERLPHMDLVHSHIGPGGFVLSAVAGNVPVVHTLHNPISDDLIRYFRQHPDDLLTTVSEFQRERLTAAGVTNRCEVIHNAVDAADYRFNDVPGDRALFMGRLDRHKGPDIALAAATAAGVPLDLAGPMTTPAFFDKTIRPLLRGPHEYVGVARGERKIDLLANARCLVMPSRWPEPFGIVAIEAMASGTPVVALKNGALPELVEDGVTGIVVDREEDVAAAIPMADRLHRRTIRERAVARFDIHTAAARWMDYYRSLAPVPS